PGDEQHASQSWVPGRGGGLTHVGRSVASEASSRPEETTYLVFGLSLVSQNPFNFPLIPATSSGEPRDSRERARGSSWSGDSAILHEDWPSMRFELTDERPGGPGRAPIATSALPRASFDDRIET